MAEDRTGSFAQVAVLAHLGRAGGLYTYRVPDALVPSAHSGSLVRVPFNNRHLQGLICGLERETDLPRIREIVEVLDPVPALAPYQLELAQWISEYYASPLSDVLGAMLPPGLGRRTIHFLEIASDPDGAKLDDRQKGVLERIAECGRLSADELARSMPEAGVDRALASLVRRGFVRRTAELAAPKVRARKQRIVRITPAGERVLSENSLGKAPRQEAVLRRVAVGEIPSSDLSQEVAGAASTLKSLVKKGLLEVEEREIRRSPVELRRLKQTQPLPLSDPQAEALRQITATVDKETGEVFLLHGVTGSGKTEVYLQAVDEVTRSGRQAIVMVPEISLTPQAVQRFAGRFPGRVAVLHSKLSEGERVDEWQRIRQGEVDVVVGARSAIFAPLLNPGLIVVDEEHDGSYKQDSSPRYHARQAAVKLGQLLGATVVLGSATPDVSTYYAAKFGRIKLLELPDRPVWKVAGDSASASRAMPPVEVVDLRQELKGGNKSIFSRSLRQELDRTLANGHQAILFLNRRGSATFVICRDCGYVARCPNCDVPFTHHSASTRLICHRCNKRAAAPAECQECGSKRIRYLGVGTQRVEEEVSRIAPGARVLRWDRDVTGGKQAHDRILNAFSRHEADILVGTQMIAKGLDFPLVTLVGVISADTGLHLPDFRAPERTFQLLTQVSGRAGRATLPSRVVVQTYTPDHYSIQAAKDHDYERFYRDEIDFRHEAKYPPFARLIRFLYSGQGESDCREAAEELRQVLEGAIAEEKLSSVEIIGPAPCFVARVKNRYYWHLIARGGSADGALRKLLPYVTPGWAVDVDPVDLL